MNIIEREVTKLSATASSSFSFFGGSGTDIQTSLTRFEGLAVPARGRIPLDEELRVLLRGLVKVFRVEHEDVVLLFNRSVSVGDRGSREGDGDECQGCCPRLPGHCEEDEYDDGVASQGAVAAGGRSRSSLRPLLRHKCK